MVDITIYIEGTVTNNPIIDTIGNNTGFRENFHKLFAQKLGPAQFNLKIIPFGSITQTPTQLKHIETQQINGVVLIDLDAPKTERMARLRQYEQWDTTKIFFMIQEMEAWILSQVDKIELFAKNERLTRKKPHELIQDNPLLKAKNPEDIIKPSEKLDTVLRQYFDVVKKRQGQEKKSGKRYFKAKDGPILIGLLELPRLMDSFDEVQNLVAYIQG